MTKPKQTKILGESTGTGRYNPDLAKQVARQAEIDEQQARLEAKTRKPAEQITSPINPNALAREGYVYVPSLGLYISEKKYFDGKNWQETQERLHKEGRRMPTIPEFIEFLKVIRRNKELPGILAESLTDTMEAEWLDAEFQDTIISGIYVSYYAFDNPKKIVRKKEKLEEYLQENQMQKINLDAWLNDHTKQGLPKPNCQKGDLIFWQPEDDHIARFMINEDKLVLSCAFPPFEDANIGVRYVEHPDNLENQLKNEDPFAPYK